jgi:protein-tyrosine phosphatase
MKAVLKVGSHRLFVGNLEGARSVALLRKHQIGSVLSVLHSDISDVSAQLRAEGIRHRAVDLPDRRDADVRALFEPLHQHLREELRTCSVLVHCVVGVSRSATIALAFMMIERRVDYATALSEMRRKKEDLMPNVGFINALLELEEALELQP